MYESERAKNMDEQRCVIDLGANLMKIGHYNDKEPKEVLNGIIKSKSDRRRIYIGDQYVDELEDKSSVYYTYTFQKGYLCNWDVQKQLFHYVFGPKHLNLNTEQSSLLITEPICNFKSIKVGLAELLFEDYNFESLSIMSAPQMSSAHYYQTCQQTSPNTEINSDCCLIVDCGFSFIHIVPIQHNLIISSLVKRIDVGGKLLTNYLKEIISFRQLNVLDETYVINQMKEDCCFVSEDFYKDANICKMQGRDNTIIQEYVLPDHFINKRGYILQNPKELTDGKFQQTVKMNIERFAIPEIMFSPTDIGINQMGLSEAIAHVILSAPIDIQSKLASNIVLTGGCCMFSGFENRLKNDLLTMLPSFYNIRIHFPDDPVTYAWYGGCVLASDDNFKNQYYVTRQQYKESGIEVFLNKFSPTVDINNLNPN